MEQGKKTQRDFVVGLPPAMKKRTSRVPGRTPFRETGRKAVRKDQEKRGKRRGRDEIGKGQELLMNEFIQLQGRKGRCSQGRFILYRKKKEEIIEKRVRGKERGRKVAALSNSALH